MMKLSVEKLHITSLQKAYGALEDSSTVGLVGLAKANSEFKADGVYNIHALSKRLSKTRTWVLIIVIHRTLREAWYSSAWDRTYALFRGINVFIGRAFGKSLRCSFQGDNNLGYDIPGAFILITLLYGSCVGDDKNHEYDIPGAEPLPPLGWLLLEIQKDQQPLTMSSMLNLCMVHYQKATQCLASKLRNGQDQS
ncbi:hypothetical protein HID58_058522 [Brassica napus]|uniref:Uncharacterized protein n=1 Tax=Brassica napus TaxID=3708 RepID=A0ABQ7ZQW3_BRANA|nr:hypothetical protein HID58_058522 [Brassica napus]